MFFTSRQDAEKKGAFAGGPFFYSFFFKLNLLLMGT
jgi:hypothetical protein